ncbi:MAG: FAD-dependent oxidoreductase, partial [Candidatus Parcubacteria bacterium]|nr:FAD-dependent oxidoreductase [Candidatus Parcubacteria bacterium]
MYDLIIIGGGPAGVAAAIYAARKHLQTVLITED